MASMNFFEVSLGIHVALIYLSLMINEILKALIFCSTYMDDIIFSKSEKEHLVYSAKHLTVSDKETLH